MSRIRCWLDDGKSSCAQREKYSVETLSKSWMAGQNERIVCNKTMPELMYHLHLVALRSTVDELKVPHIISNWFSGCACESERTDFVSGDISGASG